MTIENDEVTIGINTFLKIIDDKFAQADKEARTKGYYKLHNHYIHGYIDYFDYLEEVYKKINQSRKRLGLESLSKREFEHHCEYRNLNAKDWKEVRVYITNIILNWL